MKTINKIVFVVSLFMVYSLSALAQTVDINNSRLVWTASKVGGSHTGEISLLAASLEVKGERIVSGEFIIDMTSITCTDIENKQTNQRLVNHLRSDDFFDVSNHRVSTLRISESTVFGTDGKATVHGELTIRGTTQAVTFSVQKEGANYTADIEVDRTRYGIRYGSGSFFDNLGDNMIHDTFTVEVNLVTR